MFSSRAPRLLAAALMDLAEAMLRPLDDVDAAAELTQPLEAPAGALAATGPRIRPTLQPADSWLLDDEPFADARPLSPAAERHLQRRRHQGRSVSRRPGAIAPSPALCSTPVANVGRRTPALPERHRPALPRS
jgi:hypothetical protein